MLLLAFPSDIFKTYLELSLCSRGGAAETQGEHVEW